LPDGVLSYQKLGLPDGIFSYQKIPIGVYFGGPWN
jgi:hypothetical protein